MGPPLDTSQKFSQKKTNNSDFPKERKSFEGGNGGKRCGGKKKLAKGHRNSIIKKKKRWKFAVALRGVGNTPAEIKGTSGS